MQPIVLDDPRIQAIERRLDLDIEALLRTLPSEQREAVRRRVLGEESYTQIALSFDCSEHVIRQRVSRGLSALRRSIKEVS